MEKKRSVTQRDSRVHRIHRQLCPVSNSVGLTRLMDSLVCQTILFWLKPRCLFISQTDHFHIFILGKHHWYGL